jgi:S1-C subfamily serine protease
MRSFLAALLGGVVAIAIAAVLVETGAIDVGGEKVVQRQAPLSSGSSVAQVYEKVGPGVAFIRANVVEATSNPYGFPEQQEGQSTGSGFVLDDDGYVATNAHVINGARDVTVSFSEGEAVPAKIVGKDLSTDLAVVKVDPGDVKLTPVPLGASRDVHVGDPVVAIGNPFGYEDTVTSGIVSAIQRQIEAPNDFTIDHVIQTDAAINPGNSGGPLLDAKGRVIGINSQIATGGGQGSVGIGFAVPVALAKQVFPQLIKEGRVEHAYVGITSVPVSPELARELKLPADEGAFVQSVAAGGPADRAGVRAGTAQVAGQLVAGGDLIVGVDGRTVKDPSDISAAIGDDKPGERVEVEFFRGRERRTVEVTLGNRPNTSGQAP